MREVESLPTCSGETPYPLLPLSLVPLLLANCVFGTFDTQSLSSSPYLPRKEESTRERKEVTAAAFATSLPRPCHAVAPISPCDWAAVASPSVGYPSPCLCSSDTKRQCIANSDRPTSALLLNSRKVKPASELFEGNCQGRWDGPFNPCVLPSRRTFQRRPQRWRRSGLRVTAVSKGNGPAV